MSEAILLFFVVVLLFERWHLNRHRAKIPVRVHVNGSRGKSSTTRLIASSLRGNGVLAVGKTTGTLPRVIFEDGKEEPIVRSGPTNIAEQIKVFKWLSRKKVDALVIECMALKPDYQAICERQIIQSSIGVITNIRADHLDVMGPTENDVALALGATIPENGYLVTAEKVYLKTLEECCKARNSRLLAVTQKDIEAISNDEMNNFVYYEHKENVAVALKVAEILGLSRQQALQGMWAATPDPGALRALAVSGEKDIYFVNGFAANDPTSSELIWNLALQSFTPVGRPVRRCVLLNLRCDRVDRTQQLLECVSHWAFVDDIYIMGTAGALVGQVLRKSKLDIKIRQDFGQKSAREIYQLLSMDSVEGRSIVIGIGNVAGEGLNLVDEFARHGRAVSCNEFVKDVVPMRPVSMAPSLELQTEPALTY